MVYGRILSNFCTVQTVLALQYVLYCCLPCVSACYIRVGWPVCNSGQAHIIGAPTTRQIEQHWLLISTATTCGACGQAQQSGAPRCSTSSHSTAFDCLQSLHTSLCLWQSQLGVHVPSPHCHTNHPAHLLTLMFYIHTQTRSQTQAATSKHHPAQTHGHTAATMLRQSRLPNTLGAEHQHGCHKRCASKAHAAHILMKTWHPGSAVPSRTQTSSCWHT